MSERLKRLEEMIRATEDALSSIHDGNPERLLVAGQSCGQALEASVLAGDPDFRSVEDPQERLQLQAAVARLRELTSLCLREAANAQDFVTQGQRRAGEIRHFLDATRNASPTRLPEFDQEG